MGEERKRREAFLLPVTGLGRPSQAPRVPVRLSRLQAYSIIPEGLGHSALMWEAEAKEQWKHGGH